MTWKGLFFRYKSVLLQPNHYIMEPLKIATVQFETRDNDKIANLDTIRDICLKASAEGADVVAFHECSVCGYTFAKDLSYEELLAIADPIPSGESTQTLIDIAREADVTILAGFFERDESGRIYKAQIYLLVVTTAEPNTQGKHQFSIPEAFEVYDRIDSITY